MKKLFRTALTLAFFCLFSFSCNKEHVQLDTTGIILLELKAIQYEIAVTISSTRNITQSELKKNLSLAEDYYYALAELARRFDQQQQKLESLGIQQTQRREITAENWQQIMSDLKQESSLHESTMELSCFKIFLSTLAEMNQELFLSPLEGSFFEEIIDWYFDFRRAIRDFYDCLEKYKIR